MSLTRARCSDTCLAHFRRAHTCASPQASTRCPARTRRYLLGACQGDLPRERRRFRAPAGPPVVSTRTHGCWTAVCSQRRIQRAGPSRDETTRRLQRDSTAAGMASTAWSDAIAPLPLYLSFFRILVVIVALKPQRPPHHHTQQRPVMWRAHYPHQRRHRTAVSLTLKYRALFSRVNPGSSNRLLRKKFEGRQRTEKEIPL